MTIKQRQRRRKKRKMDRARERRRLRPIYDFRITYRVIYDDPYVHTHVTSACG